ncbi:hypothetical protein ABZ942_12175 [Nocardia sp. NPDC046473]|uniref:hypothetical protein n=1 Tax=Nocardia sp. NPDC046473 TaxID=3155733 RepID=UPI0033FE9D87
MSVELSTAASSAPTVRTVRSQQAQPATVDAADPIITTHRVTYSDRLKLFIGAGETIDNFLRPLRRLDGHHRYSVQLTCLPAPMRSADISPAISSAPGQNYLRCTGSADALFIELRSVVDGVAHLCTVGRAVDHDGEPEICVQVPESMPAPWIYPDEVFTAEDAAEVFAGYFHTGTVPPGLALRETD